VIHATSGTTAAALELVKASGARGCPRGVRRTQQHGQRPTHKGRAGGHGPPV